MISACSVDLSIWFMHMHRLNPHPLNFPILPTKTHQTDYVCHSDGRVESPPVEDFAGDRPNDHGSGMDRPRGGVVGGALSGM